MVKNVLARQQVIPLSIQKCWEFFSNPLNLVEITPPELSMSIQSHTESEIYNGMIISYNLKPILNLSMNWMTEIKHVRAPHFFVDEQRFGPYAFWYHQHFFKETEQGTQVDDIVYYRLPIYAYPMAIVVRSKLEKIFEYRKDFLEEKFGRALASI